jgi:hypothetical protein
MTLHTATAMSSPSVPRVALAALLSVAAIVGVSSAVERDGAPRELVRMHDDAVLEFIDSEGFGQRRLPAMSKVLHRQVDGTDLVLYRLELIGIAKHNPSKVFSAEMSIFHRPNKTQPPEPRVDGRAMTLWERQAVRDLDNGQRLVVEKRADRGLRVVGAIRAGGECLGCHKDKHAGDMLGAFVYTLGPLPRAP